MAILVTGGAGYIGSHMVLALLDAGEEVVVLDDLSTGFPWALPKAATLVIGDFGDTEKLATIFAAHRIEAIAHFAAKIVVPESVAEPLLYYLNNTAKARNLIETALAHGIKNFIFSSTAAVYGEPSVNPINEDVPPNPINPYGRSKLMVEWMLQDVAKSRDLAKDFSYVALRYFNVAGADPLGRSGQSTPNATHLIKVAVQAALGMRRGMDVFGTDYPTADGTCIRDYIHVSDLIAAHILALKHLRGGGKSLVMNCGYGHGHSVKEVIDVVKEITGVDFEVRLTGRRAGDPAALVANADRIRQRLGWQPQHDHLAEIVKQAYEWESKLPARLAQGAKSL